MISRATYLLSQLAPINDPDCPVDGAANCNINLPNPSADSATLQNALQIIFAIIAVIAVIYIIIAGLQLITSDGDSQKVAKARQTILFAVIGLAVSLLAEVIVLFVLREI